MELARTEGEICELMNRCEDKIMEGGSRFFGMTYEQGVVEALRWVVGEQDEYPYPAQ